MAEEENLKLRKKLKIVLKQNKNLEALVKTQFAAIESEMGTVRDTQQQILLAGGGGGSTEGLSDDVGTLQRELAAARAAGDALRAQLASGAGGSGSGGDGGGADAGGSSGGAGGGAGGTDPAEVAALQKAVAERDAELERLKAEQAAKEAGMREWLEKEIANATNARMREMGESGVRIAELETTLTEQSTEYEAKIKRLTTKLSHMSSSGEDKINTVKGLVKRHRALRGEWSKLRSDAIRQREAIGPAMEDFFNAIAEQVQNEARRTRKAVRRYHKIVEEKTALYDEMQSMRGNIRVYCRVRPMVMDHEVSNCVEIPTEEDVIITNPENPDQKHVFKFDRVFGPDSTQEEVFADTQPLVTSVLDGYNVCIFAYGQTGSGKTYTMDGPVENPGVNRRTLTELFRIADERKEDYRISIKVSNLEIYNDEVYDLLVPAQRGKPRTKLRIRQASESNMTVDGLTEVDVSTAEEVMAVLEDGSSNRATFATNMNEHSSRSHMLLRVIVRTQNMIASKIATVGKLTLVDLAGSERVDKSGATQQRLAEARAINLSLTLLGNVIESLSNEASHVNYRDSKLTFLLRDSLGGNSKTLMFVQVSPASYNFGESKCSLQFATRVRSVKLQFASVHTEAVATNVTDLEQQVAALQAQLASGR